MGPLGWRRHLYVVLYLLALGAVASGWFWIAAALHAVSDVAFWAMCLLLNCGAK